MSELRLPTLTSRRNFLKDASIVTAATAGIVNFPGLVEAKPGSKQNVVESIDLGVKPEAGSPGAVVVPKNRLTFVTFCATQPSRKETFWWPMSSKAIKTMPRLALPSS